MHKRTLLAVLVLAALAPLAQAGGAAPITANVLVFCPFAVSVNASPAYVRYGNIPVQYALQATKNCSTGGMAGSISLYRQNGSLALSKGLPATIANGTKIVYGTGIEASRLSNLTYTVNVSFVEVNRTVSGSAMTELFNPAIINVTQFYAAPSTLINGTLPTMFLTLENNGQLASNELSVNITVIGPSGSNSVVFGAAALQPGGAENITFTKIPVSDGVVGTYRATAVVSYATAPNALVANALTGTSTAATQYSVVNPYVPQRGGVAGGAGGSGGITPISSSPQFSVVVAPLYTSAASGSTTMGQFTLQNTATAPESIGVSYAPEFSGMISLSAEQVSLPQGQSASIVVALHPPAGMTPGTYVIPINITVGSGGGEVVRTEYITVEVLQQSQGSVRESITLTNNTEDASGIVQVTAPPNMTLQNASLETRIPLAAARNVSDITAYGLPNNITKQDGYYVITWQLPTLPPGQATYGYYTVDNQNSQALLMLSQNILTFQSRPHQPMLRVLDVKVPTFYPNMTGNVTLEMLYTGALAQPVTSVMQVQAGMAVRPDQATVNASPNMVVTQRFMVSVGNQTGTYLVYIYVSTQGYNYTYQAPLVVLPEQAGQPAAAQAGGQYPVITAFQEIGDWRFLLPLVIVVGAVWVLLSRRRRQGRRSPDRSKRLKDISEQLKKEIG